MGALSSAAALTDRHENASSKDVAKVLAEALKDDQLAVRETAIVLSLTGSTRRSR